MRRLDTAQIELLDVMQEQRIVTLFQPIIDARTRRMHGCEALSRGPSDSWLHSPLNLFDAARHAGVRLDLEFRCIELALRRAAQSRAIGRLFLNVSPDSIDEVPDFAERLRTAAEGAGFPIAHCVLELTEDSLVEDYQNLTERLEAIRATGCRIAIDDLGAGRSGLKTWSELRPDYVKIDRYFISNVDSDPTKFEFVRSITEMGHAVGCRVLAEGVETESEARDLIALGVDFMQGYLFGRPDATIPDQIKISDPAEPWTASHPGMTAEHLVVVVKPASPDTLVGEVVTRFSAEQGLDAIAIVEAERPIGLVRRGDVLAPDGQPLHPDWFNEKPVRAVMQAPPLTIDIRLRLEQVSRLVTRQSSARASDQFVITRDGRYVGMGATMNLLRQMTEQQLNMARQSNPLTLLPGNAVIHKKLECALQADQRFLACYVDLDGFKSYNDRYGYLQGDQVILQLATLLRRSISRRLDFVGHVGGDDFVLLMRSRDWRARIVSVLESFPAVVAALPATPLKPAETAEDVLLESEAPRSMSISVAALDSTNCGCATAEEITVRLAHLKKLAKTKPGNSFLLQTQGRIVDLIEGESPRSDATDLLDPSVYVA
ncbi:MAG TPA: bifunctional diguanylate cyclase/phosphodiesterase [Steroidobacteraceae bacterium]|nr:bifunctional diguanylate cyclase/phosphodiesterase [Steroidobacteraceae bacterium]